jgi:hypothetical protein
MNELKQYAIAYTISNILAVLCIGGALRKPAWTRVGLAAIFLWASYINSKTALYEPGLYLEYSRFTMLPFYKEFINGFFSTHIREIVIPIAIAQFLIFLGLLLNKIWTRLACIGGILFGIAIAPLGIGAAFPATVLMAAGFFILLTKYDHDFIWKQNESNIHKKETLHVN